MKQLRCNLRLMSSLWRYILTAVASAALGVLLEPFFSAIFIKAGINSADWAAPTLAFIRLISRNIWFQGFAVYIAGLATGLWFDHILQRMDAARRKERKLIGDKLKRISRIFADLEENSNRNADLPTTTFLERYADEVRSVEITVQKLGISTPMIDYEADPIGFVQRMRVYASRIAPLISEGHLKEAKREAKSLSQRIRMEAPLIATESSTFQQDKSS